MKDKIKWLINTYNNRILKLEEDMRTNTIGNAYRQGAKSELVTVVNDLTDLLDEIKADK